MKKILLSIMFAVLVCVGFAGGYVLTKHIYEKNETNYVDVVAKDYETKDMFQIGDDLKDNCKVVWYTITKVTINTDYNEELTRELGNYNIYKIDSVVYAKDEHKFYQYVCYAHITFANNKVEYISEYELGE